jgi:hypothetical protein
VIFVSIHQQERGALRFTISAFMKASNILVFFATTKHQVQDIFADTMEQHMKELRFLVANVISGHHLREH